MIPTYIPTPNSSANAKNAAVQNSKTISATLRIRFKLPNLRFQLALTPAERAMRDVEYSSLVGVLFCEFFRIEVERVGNKGKISHPPA
jgi:hypothetical protein